MLFPVLEAMMEDEHREREVKTDVDDDEQKKHGGGRSGAETIQVFRQIQVGERRSGFILGRRKIHQHLEEKHIKHPLIHNNISLM